MAVLGEFWLERLETIFPGARRCHPEWRTLRAPIARPVFLTEVQGGPVRACAGPAIAGFTASGGTESSPHPHGERVLSHPAEGAPDREHLVGSGTRRSPSEMRDTSETGALLVAGLLLAVATALRLYRLGQDSLWVDEYASLLVAKLPLAAIPAGALRGDAFEPSLYFLLLHFVIGILGESEEALRLLSALAGAVTVPLALVLFRALGASTGAAALGAALLAISPLHLWYSQEARPYALLLCLGLGSLVCLLRALRTGGRLACSVSLGLVPVILTHVVGLLFPSLDGYGPSAPGAAQRYSDRFSPLRWRLSL